MSPELDDLLTITPVSVGFQCFGSPEDIDIRRGCVDVLFANIIGINANSAEWMPNCDPPDLNERLAWIWFVRPDLANEMIGMVDGDFRRLLESYRDHHLDGWWSRLIQG